MKPSLASLPTTPILLALGLACAACDKSAPALDATGTPVALEQPASAAELQGLARSDNAFALDFYGKVRSRPGNLVMSPFSVSTALEMALAGARGETAAQMARVLHQSSPADRALDIRGLLLASYAAPGQHVTLRVANRLFGEKTYPFEQPYLAHLTRALGAPLLPLDFRGHAEESRARVNGWVSEETHGRIEEIVPPGGIDADTRLALVNAIYFLGDWAVPFRKESTSPAPFFTGDAAQKEVPTMHLEEHLPFAATDGVEILELPYQGGALAMDFVLPDARDGLAAVEARLTPAVFDRWIGAATTTNVDVSLPKLEIAPPDALSVGDTLAALGMPLAFDCAGADFTGIGNPSRGERLFLSKVFHKAFIKLDEKGTEAAAATAAVPAVAGLGPVAEAPRQFKADHPFLFFLRDVRSGLVLFMGRAADPASR